MDAASGCGMTVTDRLAQGKIYLIKGKNKTMNRCFYNIQKNCR